MLGNEKKDIYISEELRYYNLANIFFDAPISTSDIDILKDIFFSINNLSQIYFRKNIDIKSIELVKYLLEISPTMNDSNVEKYIIDEENKLEKIFEMSFFNPNTWYIKTIYDDKKFYRIDKFKEIKKEINKIKSQIDENSFSQTEKIIYLYDYCKYLKLDKEENSILDILKYKKTNNNGIVKLLNILLKEIGISSYIGTSIVNEEQNPILLVEISDEKYNINGIYLIDILSDYIESNNMNEKVKTLNYNFFCITLNDYTKTIFNDKLYGITNCLSHDIEYDYEKINNIPKIEIKKLEESFNKSYKDIHNEIENTKKIKEDIIIQAISIINKNNYEIIKKNYYERNNKLFNYNINE